MSELFDQAQELYRERQASAGSPGWNRERFIRRVRRLAQKIERAGADPETGQARIYLDVIAVREGIELTYGTSRATSER